VTHSQVMGRGAGTSRISKAIALRAVMHDVWQRVKASRAHTTMDGVLNVRM
jgi:hypothetical protein